jgi:hypothetical protein
LNYSTKNPRDTDPQLQELSGTKGKDWMKWEVDTVDKYNQYTIKVDAWIKIGEELKKP